MTNMKIEIDNYIAVKYPLAFLQKDTGTSLFTEIGNDLVLVHDDIPKNYPRWAYAIYKKDEAIEQIRELIDNHGWELIRGTVIEEDEW